MLCEFVKCGIVLAKRPQFLLFSTAQVRNEYSLKTFRASLFNEDQSNEPNFGCIHLAGQ